MSLLFEAEATLGEEAKIRSMPKTVPAGRMDSVEKNEKKNMRFYAILLIADWFSAIFR